MKKTLLLSVTIATSACAPSIAGFFNKSPNNIEPATNNIVVAAAQGSAKDIRGVITNNAQLKNDTNELAAALAIATDRRIAGMAQPS